MEKLYPKLASQLAQLEAFNLALPPLARCQTSPLHLIIRSTAAVGPSTAGRTSK